MGLICASRYIQIIVKHCEKLLSEFAKVFMSLKLLGIIGTTPAWSSLKWGFFEWIRIQFLKNHTTFSDFPRSTLGKRGTLFT